MPRDWKRGLTDEDHVEIITSGLGFTGRARTSILSELQYLKKNFGTKTVFFFDETFTIDARRAGVYFRKRNMPIDFHN
jgi:hypothetical protein